MASSRRPRGPRRRWSRSAASPSTPQRSSVTGFRRSTAWSSSRSSSSDPTAASRISWTPESRSGRRPRVTSRRWRSWACSPSTRAAVGPLVPGVQEGPGVALPFPATSVRAREEHPDLGGFPSDRTLAVARSRGVEVDTGQRPFHRCRGHWVAQVVSIHRFAHSRSPPGCSTSRTQRNPTSILWSRSEGPGSRMGSTAALKWPPFGPPILSARPEIFAPRTYSATLPAMSHSP